MNPDSRPPCLVPILGIRAMARFAILVCLACVVPARGDARPSIAKIGALVDTLDAQLQQLQQLEKRKEKR